MSVPTKLIPICPHCGKHMLMNLRADDTFVEDESWHAAAAPSEIKKQSICADVDINELFK